jgi:hypothetical protein
VDNQEVRLLLRRVKLFRDQLVDNYLIIDAAKIDFLEIIRLIFDNAPNKSPEDLKIIDECIEQQQINCQEKSNDDIKNESNKNQETVENISSKASSLDKDFKKLYREIVKKVHPDRYDILGVKSKYQKKRLSKIFINAKTFVETSFDEGIIEICAQLEIDIDHLHEEDVKDKLARSEDRIKDSIKKQMGTLHYLWHQNAENMDNKVKIIEAFIENSSYQRKNVTSMLVKDVITSYNSNGLKKKRKVGERPPKLRR